MAVIHTEDHDPHAPPPPHIAAMAKLHAAKDSSTQRMMIAAEQATMDMLINVFNLGYETRKNEEKANGKA